ncbi:MAG: AAA family ATPase [Methylocystis sp.]
MSHVAAITGERVISFEPPLPIAFKTAARFCGEYVPLAYTVEPLMRSASLYALTARTGAGKTAFNVVVALAVATGRQDILNREVVNGRVAYLACENPDDIRMRFKIAAYLLNIDLDELGDRLLILDFRAKPEAVHAELKRLAEQEPFALVIVDTLAAFFDGDNINDAVQGGQFMRRLRPLTQIAGLPSVLVAAHPVKNASEEALVPYGSGAILNEIDGNLTLWKNPQTGLVSLHWQGKLRGLEFEPVPFRFEIMGCPDILDAKGREVQLPTLRPASEQAAEDRQQAELDGDYSLLRAMLANPAAPQSEYAAAIGCSKSSINRRLQRLAREKLVQQFLEKWSLTEKGKKCLS